MSSFFDLFLVAAGLFVGSFITAAARAWPDWSVLLRPRSGCEGCGRPLGLTELVPVASYLVQRGKCRSCGTAIWSGHPIGEAGALAVALAAVFLTDGWAAPVTALLGWTLLFGALVDARTQLLPDLVTLGLIPAGLAAAWLMPGPPAILDASLGAIFGFAVLWGLGAAYRLIRKREGLGMGDAKLLAAGGAWCGLYALPWIVAIGAGATLIFIAIKAVLGEKLGPDTPIAFGPGLCAGIFVAHLIVQHAFPFGY